MARRYAPVAMLLAVMQLASVASASIGSASDVSLAPVPGTWFTQNGPIAIHFRDASRVRVNGVLAPGVEANAKDDATLSNSIGYHFTPNLSAQLVLGVPGSTRITNQDGLRLGKTSYGAPSVLLDYRLNDFGFIQPFVGVGAMYLFFYDEKDGALSNLKVKDSVGAILRAGAEVMFTPNVGVYFAANKVFIDANARAFLGPNRVAANLKLDPWILQAGLTYRF